MSSPKRRKQRERKKKIKEESKEQRKEEGKKEEQKKSNWLCREIYWLGAHETATQRVRHHWEFLWLFHFQVVDGRSHRRGESTSLSKPQWLSLHPSRHTHTQTERWDLSVHLCSNSCHPRNRNGDSRDLQANSRGGGDVARRPRFCGHAGDPLEQLFEDTQQNFKYRGQYWGKE